MRLPQSTLCPFRGRVVSFISVVLFTVLLPLSSGASTQQLSCTPCSIRFGAVPIGQTETEIVVLSNSGDTSVTVSAFKLTGSEFSVFNLRLPLDLAPGQKVALRVSFSPITMGATGEQVTLTSNASNSQLQLEFQGSGISSTSVIARPASVEFGQVPVGNSSTRRVLLSNATSQNVKISAYEMTGTGFSVTGPTLPVTLNAGQSIALELTYAPVSAETDFGSLLVSGPNRSVPLNGVGTSSAGGQLTISPSVVNFGDVTVGTTEKQPITMSAAKESVTVSSDASSNSQFVLDGASFPFTIPAGKSVSFNVAFTPKSTGNVSGSLSFTSNASDSPIKESLNGTGTAQLYSVNLYWNASDDVVGYNVYRSLSANGKYFRINPSLDPNTAYTDATVASGRTYYYEATSVNAAGQESVRSTPPVVASIP
jgi:Abnormal spindle-like microcephaly-assoc'd, ASPM-SPD-2-Hydin